MNHGLFNLPVLDENLKKTEGFDTGWAFIRWLFAFMQITAVQTFPHY